MYYYVHDCLNECNFCACAFEGEQWEVQCCVPDSTYSCLLLCSLSLLQLARTCMSVDSVPSMPHSSSGGVSVRLTAMQLLCALMGQKTESISAG